MAFTSCVGGRLSMVRNANSQISHRTNKTEWKMVPHGGLTSWGCWRVRCEMNTPLWLQRWEAQPQEVEGTTWERVPFGNNASTVYGRTNRPPLPRVTNRSLWQRCGGCYPVDPGLKPEPRGVPFLRCPGGRSRPILVMPTSSSLEYTSSSDSLWGSGGKESQTTLGSPHGKHRLRLSQGTGTGSPDQTSAHRVRSWGWWARVHSGGLGPEHWRTSGTKSPGVFTA